MKIRSTLFLTTAIVLCMNAMYTLAADKKNEPAAPAKAAIPLSKHTPLPPGKWGIWSGFHQPMCMALLRSLEAYGRDPVMGCEKKIHPSVKSVKILEGEPLNANEAFEFWVRNEVALNNAKNIEKKAALEPNYGIDMRKYRGEELAKGQIKFSIVYVDINRDGIMEPWFQYKKSLDESLYCSPEISRKIYPLLPDKSAFDIPRILKPGTRNEEFFIHFGSWDYAVTIHSDGLTAGYDSTGIPKPINGDYGIDTCSFSYVSNSTSRSSK